MAEVFGVISGALSVAALFNNCVDCFEYVQLSRHFGQDYGRCQLKLDIERLRLSRWGESVQVNTEPSFATDAPDDRCSQEAQVILEEIQTLFQATERASKRYEIRMKKDDTTTSEAKDWEQVTQGLHGRIETIARQRQKRASLLKKAAWGLYGRKNFETLVEQITGFIDDLEKLFPAEATRREIVEREIEGLNDEPTLLALKDAATGTDNDLNDATQRKLEDITGKNYAKEIRSEEMARVLVGNVWTQTGVAHQANFADKASNTADSVAAKGRSAVQIGNQYGGRGIFDE